MRTLVQKRHDNNRKRPNKSHKIRRERADLIEVYKIMNNIEQVEKDTFFKFPNYAATRGHQFKLAKKQHRLKVRSNSFSLRVIDSWNSLPDKVVMAPSLNSFKSRLNTFGKELFCVKKSILVTFSVLIDNKRGENEVNTSVFMSVFLQN